MKQIRSEISVSQSLLVYITAQCNLINLCLSTECFYTRDVSGGKQDRRFNILSQSHSKECQTRYMKSTKKRKKERKNEKRNLKDIIFH